MTKEDLQKEFDFDNKALKLKEAPFWMLYSQFLEQKLIYQPQEREQREVSAEEYIHSKYWFKGGYIGIDKNSLFQLMEEYADLKTLSYIVDKNVKLFNELKDQSQEPKQMSEVELHKCKWCNVMTTQSDDVCYANPNNRPEQREVSEELQYQNLTCLINGFELNSYQKALAKKEFNRLISIKQTNK